MVLPLIVAVATLVFPVPLNLGVAPPEQVAVNTLFVPYVVVPVLTVVLPSFIVGLPLTLFPLNVYSAVAALHCSVAAAVTVIVALPAL